MRKIVRWAESANLQEEKGNKIKKWRRGTELIRKSNPRKWIGQGIQGVIDLLELEKKSAYHLDILLDQRDALNERKINIRKKLEALETLKVDERIKPSFFHRMKTNKNKEEIFALIDDKNLGKETRVPAEIRNVATTFYKELWGNLQGTRAHSIRKMSQLYLTP